MSSAAALIGDPLTTVIQAPSFAIASDGCEYAAPSILSL
jgi:hypothetical protein